MDLADEVAVGTVGADEAGESDNGAVSKEAGDLTNAADVLGAI